MSPEPFDEREHYDTWMSEDMTMEELLRVAAWLRLCETPEEAARADSDDAERDA